MAYASYRHGGNDYVGEVAGSRLIPLSGLTELGITTTPDVLSTATRDESASVEIGQVTLLPVVPQPSKVLCVGLNYRDHVLETKRELPSYPVFFPKYADSLIGAHDDILGYTVANDITMRDFQYKTHQWMQGKAWDASTPLGPYLVTPGEIDVDTAGIRTVLNGEKMQESDLSQLIFTVPRLIATISTFTVLRAGDVILTGTPGGVGYRRDPKVLLSDGDRVSVEIDGIGATQNAVTA